MAADLHLRHARVPDREELVDIVIEEGRITSIGVATETAVAGARETIDLDGRVVTAGLVEAHVHLDKALLDDRVTATAGTLEEAIRVTGEAKRSFTVDDIRERARRALDLAVRAGTTAMRTHVEVDPIVGLAGMEAVLPLRDEYRPALDLQICAFPQEGIVGAPGTEGLLRRALTMGADLIGGCPYTDADGAEHVRIVFGLAVAFGVDVDFHVDFADEADHLHIRDIVAETERTGWRGRVAVGHLTELAAVAPYHQDELIAHIAGAGIGVIALPITDLYLMGRRDVVNVRRGLTPVRRLLDGGVRVALASNNIRNPFTPVGTADLADLPYLAAVAAHMGTPADLLRLLATITAHPAAILRLPEYGLDPGRRADLVAWDCRRVTDIVAARPQRTLVIKRGRVTVVGEHRVVERWRATG
ncbi:MAG TPA: amidohydrolase family protein [Methylomirabilota bacterium]|nr:amidohydrolase family protein [Methylomirabilota bacterium]